VTFLAQVGGGLGTWLPRFGSSKGWDAGCYCQTRAQDTVLELARN